MSYAREEEEEGREELCCRRSFSERLASSRVFYTLSLSFTHLFHPVRSLINFVCLSLAVALSSSAARHSTGSDANVFRLVTTSICVSTRRTISDVCKARRQGKLLEWSAQKKGSHLDLSNKEEEEEKIISCLSCA